MYNRPLTIRIGHEDVALEQICPACKGTNKWHPDLSDNLTCDFCAGGYVPTRAGEIMLLFITIHFKKVMPNVAVLSVLTKHLSVRS